MQHPFHVRQFLESVEKQARRRPLSRRRSPFFNTLFLCRLCSRYWGLMVEFRLGRATFAKQNRVMRYDLE